MRTTPTSAERRPSIGGPIAGDFATRCACTSARPPWTRAPRPHFAELSRRSPPHCPALHRSVAAGRRGVIEHGNDYPTCQRQVLATARGCAGLRPRARRARCARAYPTRRPDWRGRGACRATSGALGGGAGRPPSGDAAQPPRRHPLDVGDTYLYLRRYTDALTAYDKSLALNPGSTNIALQKALAYLSQTGDREGTERIMPPMTQRVTPIGGPTGIMGLSNACPLSVVRSRNRCFASRSRHSSATPPGGRSRGPWSIARGGRTPPPGLRSRRPAVSSSGVSRCGPTITSFSPNKALRWPDSAAARKDAEGRRAVEARPISRDAVDGPLVVTNIARIYTLLGRTDAAGIDQLRRARPVQAGPVVSRVAAGRPVLGPAPEQPAVRATDPLACSDLTSFSQ